MLAPWPVSRLAPAGFIFPLTGPPIACMQLAIVVAVILFSAETAANGLRQLLFGMMVLLAALLSHMYTYPFDRKTLNHLESGAIAALFFALFVGLAFLSDKMSYGFKMFMEVRHSSRPPKRIHSAVHEPVFPPQPLIFCTCSSLLLLPFAPPNVAPHVPFLRP